MSFALEKQVAISAVLRACRLTSSVFTKLVTAETVTKNDKSPVTVADYAAQAVINTVLSRAFPEDAIVGEEDAGVLRNPGTEEIVQLKAHVVALANDALSTPANSDELPAWSLGSPRTPEQLLDAIDRGQYAGGRTGRMWALDPIDGTKGFLRGGQYAVCLALIVDSVVQLGVMGCPNLPVNADKPEGEKGCLFVAVRGEGATQRSFTSPTLHKLLMPTVPPESYQVLESLEAAHSSHSFSSLFSNKLHITRPPLRMDSQAKYCSLARGQGAIYLRMPTGVGYREKIWDHASGSLLVQEAGGLVTDGRGLPLDFGLGRTLGENFGIIAANKEIHPKVIEAIKAIQEEESKGKSG
ncbi:3-2-5-bisphosphate nucleotidase HAL2 [Dacryopinax primogenitus]|uniref:3'(2'),5'-bisphosphate nucleotidase n=1 Tax=Dacryopinax primogenitus (strain DJM 731) TaxID=1858805 RepID=M5FW93_DACPD|nr:3-2-5-bisphosphate nucleotidase HAL2 [Dacryopinax primogenitus]EJU00639.1 3-2-5-bisphosphate nucleotidase HAL2 [Dacryopinax primogenitus]